MSSETTAVLVIDVQRGLFDPEPRPFEADAVVARINALTERAHRAGVPVAFIQHETVEGLLAFHSDSWLLESNLSIRPGDALLRKTTPDSFLRTGLQDWLAKHGCGRVVLCGYASEFCVDTTARRAAALGYEVVLAADAHTTHDKPHASAAAIRRHHNHTLAEITSFGPRISAEPSAQIDLDP
jgi:nicotinamidase-related amidase